MIKVNEGTEANVSKIINIMDQIVFSDATVQSTNPLLSTIAHALLRTIAERKAKKQDDSASSAANDDRDGGVSKSSASRAHSRGRERGNYGFESSETIEMLRELFAECDVDADGQVATYNMQRCPMMPMGRWQHATCNGAQ